MIENAKITGTFLGKEDHGILTAFVYLEFDGCGQGFGGFDLRRAKDAVDFVQGVLDAVGADSWEKLAGKYCRIAKDSMLGPIEAIGHIIEDRWFNFRKTR